MGTYARLEDVTLAYGPKVVLRNLNLEIVEGATTCVVGTSGAGKSTILRLLNGLRKPTAGRVLVEGRDIGELSEHELIDVRKQIGFSFQFAALFDSLSIGDNIALPLREHTDLAEDEIRTRVDAALESVGLHGVYDNFPSELSGGMVKRAGFARAVITRPRCVLYDEPTTGLDPIITGVLTKLIVQLRRQLNGTAVVISHDLGSIFEMADYIAMLFQGQIVAYGTAEEIRNSTNPVMQQFLQGSEVGPIPI